MKRRRNYFPYLSFIDLILGLFICVSALLFVAMFMINPVAKNQEGVQLKAEYIIEASWPLDRDSDVDLYTQDPQGGIAYFGQKQVNMMYLDHDSLGRINSVVTLDDGSTILPREFSEIMTLKGIIPGEYVVNIHLYNARQDGMQLSAGSAYPVPVHVKITKINPKVQIVFEKDIVLNKVLEEETVTRFTLDAKGKWMGIDPTPKGLIKR